LNLTSINLCIKYLNESLMTSGNMELGNYLNILGNI
jgi:hypothetical protein